MNACHRGCRLYSICQFVNGNAGFNTSREECQGGESVCPSVCLNEFACVFNYWDIDCCCVVVAAEPVVSSM